MKKIIYGICGFHIFIGSYFFADFIINEFLKLNSLVLQYILWLVFEGSCVYYLVESKKEELITKGD